MNPHPRRYLHCGIIFALMLSTSSLLHAERVQFSRDIKPILAEACFHCHGPDPSTRKAGLRLDLEEGFFQSSDSGPTVVKGQPDRSPLLQRILTHDPDEIMPPPDSHKELKPEQKALIQRWIEEGAVWQGHWAFIKPELPASPQVKGSSWIRQPLDRFVLANLESTGLQPAPEADRHTLARRVSLDLTGLPPKPELVASFVQDTSPGAYEKLVDHLLESRAYGEHRARYWLDAARYGDTHGLHFDNYREMWPYRDWVVRSFNSNQPFDSFTVEQLAGDLLPNRTEDQLIATGLQRCNITTNEGGTIAEENLANYAADRVQTLGWVYMGLTANCAQCHDHKFDPITQRDYYALAAFFRNTTQGALDGNKKDSGPILVLPQGEDLTRWTSLPQEIASTTAQRDTRKKEAKGSYDAWLASASPETLEKDMPGKELIAHIPLNEGAGSTVNVLCGPPAAVKATGEISWSPEGKIGPSPVLGLGKTFELGSLGDFESDQPFSYGAWIKAGRNGVQGGIIARMDEKGGYRGWDLYQADRNLAVHIIHQWPDNALKVSTPKPVLNPGTWQHVFVTYDGSRKPGGIKIYVDGVDQKLRTDNRTLQAKATIRTQTPTRIGQRSHLQIFDGGSIQDVRMYARRLNPQEVSLIATAGPLRAILASAPQSRSPEQQESLYDYYLTSQDASYQQLTKQISNLEKEKENIRKRSPVTHVQEEVMGVQPMAHILLRGQYDKLGDQVEAAPPAALGSLPPGAPKNRLGLAQWLVAPENPLTARVTVNRFWQEIFGSGLVKTSDDFGIMGMPPSNQALLDWLAIDFQNSGWDVKRFFKQIVTSATYRQASITTPEKLEKDRENAFLSRGPRFRMDAEMVRDYALASSGLLSEKMGGPGVRPYQPEGIWDVVGLPGGDTRNYVQSTGDDLYRRTLYSFWKRMAPPPSLEAFNAPSREFSCIRRERTNTPLQALVTLNDPQYVEAARVLAQGALQSGPADTSQILDYIAQRLLSRSLRAEENTILQAAYTDLLTYYRSHSEDAQALVKTGATPSDASLDTATLAAWTMICNQVMNLDEVLSK